MNKNKIKSHKMSTRSTVIECCECKKTYKRINELRRHAKAVHPDKLQVIAPLKEKNFEFTCNQCNKHFSHQRHFKSHLKTHSLDDKLQVIAPLKEKHFEFTCNQCNKHFSHQRNLKCHLKTHSLDDNLQVIAPLKEKHFEFTCNQCNKHFSHQRNLKCHLKTHSLDDNLQVIAPLKEKHFEFTCNQCNKHFSHQRNLKCHLKTHSLDDNLQVIAPLKEKHFEFTCNLCNKHFSHRRNLKFHLKTHSLDNLQEVPNSSSLKSHNKCALCDFTAKFKKNFYNHYAEVHNIQIESEIIKFNTIIDFNKWKNDFENNTVSKFVKERGSKPNTTSYYICHRSGVFKSESKGKRHLKTQGSNKINGFCPAGFKVVIEDNGSYTVHLKKTHVGHQSELGHIFLTPPERQSLATKIAAKVPFNAILDEIRDSVSGASSLERLHLLTRKDLYNIEANFNLQSTSVRRHNDAISIGAWVNEVKDSCVLFYKPQDVIMEQYPQLKKEDFVLIIMNEGQVAIFNDYSNDCICIDGTRGVNSYQFELHTALVLDNLRQGFPCAFCISNRSDEIVMTLFFECIKKETGPVSTRVFLSDMAELYYNAWTKVMSEPQFRLYCTWDVDRAGRKNLHSINSKETQGDVYKKLRTLPQETDQSAFERMHRTIEYIYLHGKNVKRLDKAVHALMKFTRDQLFDRLIVVNKGKISSKLTDLRKRHKSSIAIETTSISKVGDVWLVPSTSNTANTFEMYTIVENESPCDCQLVCADCETCIHKYSCSCLDSAIRWNMCKHIHLLCRYRKLETPSASSNINSLDTENEFEIFIDENLIEADTIFEKISNKPSSSGEKTLIEKKRELQEIILSLCSSLSKIETDEECEALKKLIAPIEPTLAALRESRQSSFISKNKNVFHAY